MKDWAAIKRAQRMFPIGDKCHDCGSVEHLQRHHIDFNNRNNWIGNIVTVCGTCHYQRHIAGGTDWGCIKSVNKK